MPHIYTTHIAQSPVPCQHCRRTILIDDEFAVTTTPSKPSHINCLPCTDQRLDAGEKGLCVESTVGDHPGKLRAAQ